MTQQAETKFESWALLELMGHQRIVGKLTEEVHFGVPMARMDVPAINEEPAYTVFHGGASIYRITPITEEIAMRMMANMAQQPISSYELREPRPALGAPRDDDDEDYDDEDD